MRRKKGFRKYTWIGNRISRDDMARLYRMKEKTKRPITSLVAEAVSCYVSKLDKEKCQAWPCCGCLKMKGKILVN